MKDKDYYFLFYLLFANMFFIATLAADDNITKIFTGIIGFCWYFASLYVGSHYD